MQPTGLRDLAESDCVSNSQAEKCLWWQDFRRLMPVADEWAFFDHASVAPLAGPAATRLRQWADDVAANGIAGPGAWGRRVADVRRLAAQMVGADRDEIALVGNTTQGIGLVAEGYPWQQGDNVVIFDGEFPSNLYPWMNLESRGVETRWVKTEGARFEPRTLENACDSRTRIVAISWVSYSSGWRNDLDQLAELAHRRGALLFVDAIQGLGVFPLDVRRIPVDFFAADGHKWILGPEGAGLLFIRREHLDRLRPLGVGWNSVKHSGNYNHVALDLRDSAARYEGGSYNMPGLMALGACLEMLAGFDAARMTERVVEISELTAARLEEIGARIHSDRSEGRRSGIVSFELPDRDSEAVRRRCQAAKVKLSCRAGRLRVSPHAYNNEEDVERLVEAISNEG